MIHLRAKVRLVTGRTRHYIGGINNKGSLEQVAEFPPAHHVEIKEGNKGCYLLYFDEAGKCFTDGWYPSLEQAKAQSKFEFDIDENDWTFVT